MSVSKYPAQYQLQADEPSVLANGSFCGDSSLKPLLTTSTFLMTWFCVCTHMPECMPHVCKCHGSQKRVQDPPELEKRMAPAAASSHLWVLETELGDPGWSSECSQLLHLSQPSCKAPKKLQSFQSGQTLPKGPLNFGINNQYQKNWFKNQLDSRRGETQTGPEDVLSKARTRIRCPGL